MKKIKILFIFLILLFSVFAASKLLNDKFYTSHDGEGHVIRMMEFDLSLKDGQFPVRLAKRINFGLSYPFFNFNYPFIYYLSEGFHSLSLSYIASFKAIMFLSVFVGSVSLFLLALPYFGILGSFISAIFYIFAPYRFLNMYVRGDVAESLGLGLIPLLLLSVDRYLKNKKFKNILLIFVLSLLILSHNITAMIGITLAFIYLLFNLGKNKKLIIKFLLLLSVALLLTAFFWFPAIWESPLTKLGDLVNDYRSFFPAFRELIYSPWGFGAYVEGSFPGKMSPQIGIIHQAAFIFALIILVYTLIKKKMGEREKFFSFFVVISLISLFLALPLSKFFWDNLYPLKLVQIPWRFVGYIVLGCSVAAGYFVAKIKFSKIRLFMAIILMIAVLYANRNHIRVNQAIDFQNPFLKEDIYGPSTTSKDEHMPRNAPRIFEIPNQNGNVIPPNNGTSKRTIWKSNYHSFIVNLNSNGEFRDNTSYFPGWIAKVDGKEVQIDYAKDEFYRLRLNLPSGKHKVEFFFGDRGLVLIVDILSLVTLIGLIVFILKKYAFKK